MPFIAQGEEDISDDGTPALATEQAMQESLRNVVTVLDNDIHHPKMFVQEINPETGFPTVQRLVSGGIEYFNEAGAGSQESVTYSIDAILAGNMSLEEAIKALDATGKKTPQVTTTSESNVPAPSSDESLRLFGLDFLMASAKTPPFAVQIRFTGSATFQIPVLCHKVIMTEQLVVLVIDTRNVPGNEEMNFQIERGTVQVDLILPGREQSVPILPPIPQTVSFELGIIRFTLFVRQPEPV